VGAARRYAQALLDVVTSGGDPHGVGREVAATWELVDSHEQLKAVLCSRGVPAEQKKRVVDAIWSEGRASQHLRRLLALLANRDRLALLPLIAERYRLLLLARDNITPATVVSAVELDGDQLAAVSRALEGATGMAVELRKSVDASLLGGVVVMLDGRHYDGSVRGSLRALHASLAGT
jgi:F-type H+-transporting ATPase subunit delta